MQKKWTILKKKKKKKKKNNNQRQETNECWKSEHETENVKTTKLREKEKREPVRYRFS